MIGFSYSRKRRFLLTIHGIALPTLFCLSTCLLFSSCNSRSSSGPTTTVTDSGGVMIAENRGSVPDDGGGWSLAVEPFLSIGTVEGDDVYQFFGIAGVHRFRDGRIGVVDSGSREVRVFDSDGAHLQTFGQQGGGPQEFEMPALAGTVGDTLIVVDRAHHRITLIHPDEGFVGLARVSDEVGGFLNPAGSFSDGQTVYG